ncbi:hypothetical protein D9M68_638610 [compost metagenome]
MDQRGACLGHQFGRFGASPRALDGEHGQFAAFDQLNGKIGGLLAHPRQILVTGGGIDHHTVTLFDEVDDQVIDHPALLVEHAAV